jgi:hypothetical protein
MRRIDQIGGRVEVGKPVHIGYRIEGAVEGENVVAGAAAKRIVTRTAIEDNRRHPRCN